MSQPSEPRLFYRRRDAAHLLSVSTGILLRWERDGVLHALRVPGQRSVRYRAADIHRLAANIAAGRLSSDAD